MNGCIIIKYFKNNDKSLDSENDSESSLVSRTLCGKIGQTITSIIYIMIMLNIWCVWYTYLDMAFQYNIDYNSEESTRLKFSIIMSSHGHCGVTSGMRWLYYTADF